MNSSWLVLLEAAVNEAGWGAARQRESVGLRDGAEASEIGNDGPGVDDGDAKSRAGQRRCWAATSARQQSVDQHIARLVRTENVRNENNGRRFLRSHSRLNSDKF